VAVNVNLGGISFEVVNPANPAELSDGRCLEMARLSLAAFTHNEDQLPEHCRHTTEQVAYFLGIEDMPEYIAAQRNPQLLVGVKYGAEQRLWRPRTALAVETESDRLVGFASTADNVSGSEAAQRVKSAWLPKRHRTLRMIAVEPEFQGRGVGHALALLSWETAIPGQPASAYALMNEGSRRNFFLHSSGLQMDHRSGPSGRQSYGEGDNHSSQFRYHSPGLNGARKAAEHIRRKYPAVADAVTQSA